MTNLRVATDPKVIACPKHTWQAHRYRLNNEPHISWVCAHCRAVMCGNWRERNPCSLPHHHPGDHQAVNGDTWPLGGRQPR